MAPLSCHGAKIAKKWGDDAFKIEIDTACRQFGLAIARESCGQKGVNASRKARKRELIKP
ncbi:DNA primase [Prevotella dentalis DSM 3688]|uniref:DNA primase n=1 Tax=Prevotella dentalis (strain ATCC 49559 / DSM 3688 / JCM 13448 / NCTC 12043 / ES 2772) TaxID=908937 RepID=F9CZU8_PREDD|nr:DNA primase [Prevotella dentalis DSM 3688]